MKRILLAYTLSALCLLPVFAGGGEGSLPISYVNPFIGTTNFGTTNPGAVCPNGMMSVVPFNVMGSEDNKYDKDARWWSTPYEFHNCFFTGYSHVNLSGVGCPELGSLLLMPTTGELSVDYKEYGSRYEDEQASPGYYSNFLTRYNVKTEVSATLPGTENLLRPDNDDYMSLGYVPLREQYDNSVSHALEYYIADYSLSLLADALGKKEDARLFYNRSLGYKHYYSKEFGTFRPILPDGQFYTPFNPRQGENFEPNPGFHEGCAWNYTFYVPHDVKGLARLMGGRKPFIDKLQQVFDKGLYDPANEPDIAYAHLFSYFKGEEWRTQKEFHRLLQKYFKNAPDGIPGNDDTGTMSTWAIFNMMGFYPDCPGAPYYTLSTPVFDRVEIRLDSKAWGCDKLVIETQRPSAESLYINEMELGGKKLSRYRVSHEELVKGGTLKFILR